MTTEGSPFVRVFHVPATKLERLAETFTTFGRRAARLGIAAPSYTHEEAYRLAVRHREGGDVESLREDCLTPAQRAEAGWRFVPVHHVEVRGESPRLNGWTFVASLTPTEEGTLALVVPGQTLPEAYRQTDYRCDQCQTQRRRVEVYVVRHEDGTTKQVGRSCLAAFVGADKVQTAVGMLEYLWSFTGALGEAEAYEGDGGGRHVQVSVRQACTDAAYVVRTIGWVSRGRAKLDDQLVASATWVDLLGDPSAEARKLLRANGLDPREINAHDEAEAEAALAWARDLPAEGDSDYLFSLRTLARLEYAPLRFFGLACSLVPAYQREQSRLVEQKSRRDTATHYGTVGKRARKVRVTYLDSLNLGEGDFGPRYLYRFVTADGAELAWFTGNAAGFQAPDGDYYRFVPCEMGRQYLADFTVAQHGEFKGIKQTTVKRLVVAPTEPAETIGQTGMNVANSGGANVVSD